MSAQLEVFRRRLEQARFGFDARYVTRGATHGRAKVARL